MCNCGCGTSGSHHHQGPSGPSYNNTHYGPPSGIGYFKPKECTPYTPSHGNNNMGNRTNYGDYAINGSYAGPRSNPSGGSNAANRPTSSNSNGYGGSNVRLGYGRPTAARPNASGPSISRVPGARTSTTRPMTYLSS